MPYWPLSIRQIHYRLLNDPPLKQTPKRSIYDAEYYRYKNDDSSYDSLVDLLTSARYHGQVLHDVHRRSDAAAEDARRMEYSVGEFVQSEIDGFLTGFHRDRQQDQPRHIEVFGEKNTLYRMLERAAMNTTSPSASAAASARSRFGVTWPSDSAIRAKIA